MTFVMTSCGRLDLLQRTLGSFFDCCSFEFYRYLMIDGSVNKSNYARIEEQYGGRFEILYNDKNIGQAASIDRIYNLVDTEYIFHCEDDWEFHGAGFVEASLDIISENAKHLQVWIRDHDDCGHPRLEPTYFTKSGTPYKRLAPDYHGWKGFSWGPGIRRLSDYRIVRPYSAHFHPKSACPWEKAVGVLYSKLGYITVTTTSGYCRTIGRKRHIPIPESLLIPTVASDDSKKVS